MPRPSLRQAINQFCRECLYDPSERGTWRAQVHECTAKACPLYQVRPLASKAERLTTAQDGAVTVPK